MFYTRPQIFQMRFRVTFSMMTLIRENVTAVVKCGDTKFPNCKDFLEHIVLVDLPGTGDCNKSRDQMWKSKVRDCSTVWIVSEINRAGSESDAWKLLARSIKDLAQRGECRSISFICTKTDDIDTQDYMRSRKLTQDYLQITPEEICIMHRNEEAKKMVKKSFNQRRTLFKHFNCDDEFLSVYTVSSREFTKENSVLKPEQTEIPKLRDHLKKYNDSHTNKTERLYISGAVGILSLIQGSKESNAAMMDEKSKLYGNLEKELQKAFDPLVKYCQEISSSLEELLSKGAKEAEEKCYAIAIEIIEPGIDGRRFSRTLAGLCKNDGCYTTKEKEMIDLNRSLAEPMEQQIDQTFTDIFTVQETDNSLLAKIDKFTFIPEDLLSKNKKSPVLGHMLKFLQTQETNLKTELKEKIIKEKKEIYEIPYQCIKTTLQQGYQSAAKYRGTGAMRRKQDVLLKLIETSKSTMFQEARREMLEALYETLNFTKEIKTTLKKSMEYALLNANTLPNIDISVELEEVKKLLSRSEISTTKDKSNQR
uniref:Uncharacterized protein n=2 Tax=Astyanax mexicanus TaxID=7994 RepID=A0A3B1JN48_ASTMX